LPNLPVGQQYFKSIRDDNGVYVDKTEYIYKLCRPLDKGYFLSRPRRFGKSLTLDTISELFAGNRPLFRGLWIEARWDWTKTYPIIRLSLDAIGHKNGLEKALLVELSKIAKTFACTVSGETPGLAFRELIEAVAEKTGKQVVILIDEYDRPIIDYMDPYDLEKARTQRDILKEFFGILKHTSNHIRFLLITGVSKFSKVSIFSELNHLTDLTLDDQYAALCGYTQDELEHYFEPFLKTMAPDTLDRMKTWYNGYSWDAKTFVYNPFSVLNFFQKRDYRNFWFSTGTPTLWVKLMRKKFVYKLEETEVSDLVLESFTLEKFDELDLDSLMLQTGYLTIKGKTEEGSYILSYPNEEVRRSFGQFLLSEYTSTRVTVPYGPNIMRSLGKNDVGGAIKVVNDLIVAIPDQNYVKSEEKFFHAVIHLIFTMVGTNIQTEMHTAIGRLDSVIITTERIFLFEFKVNETPEAALQYIRDKRYADRLRYLNKPIIAIGVSFDPTTKGVSNWKSEDRTNE